MSLVAKGTPQIPRATEYTSPSSDVSPKNQTAKTNPRTKKQPAAPVQNEPVSITHHFPQTIDGSHILW